MGGCLNPAAWTSELGQDQLDRDWILAGIYNGFHIIDSEVADRFISENVTVENYSSATVDHRQEVEKQIYKEMINGRYCVAPEQPKIVSALGAIKKQSGGIRLIHDASRPETVSINAFCPKENVKYQSLQDAVDKIRPNYYLAKCDLSEAYRSVKIHPSNYKFTGLKWKFSDPNSPSQDGGGFTYLYDTRLCFGARRAPYIFNKLTQAVVVMMKNKGYDVVAFLDDFLLICETQTECLAAMQTLLKLLRELGFAINYSKLVTPTQRLTFLGVELDTVQMNLKLPKDKLHDLRESLLNMYGKPKTTRRDLQRLAGKLNWATQCIYGGVFYLRRLHDVIATLRSPWHRTRITRAMRADMEWWLTYLESFNGNVPMIDPRPLTPIYTDACLTSAGAVFGSDFVYYPWKGWPEATSCPINAKETLAFEIALTSWAHKLKDRKILIHCDNQCAVATINKGSSRNPVVMASLRRIFWLSVKFNFKIIAKYYSACENKIADAVSRFHECNANRWKQLGLDPIVFYSYSAQHNPSGEGPYSGDGAVFGQLLRSSY